MFHIWNRSSWRLVVLAVVALLALTVLGGCGAQPAQPATAGTSGEEPPVKLTIASGAFSEPWILAEIVKGMLEENGNFQVEHLNNFQGSTVLHEAMLSGDVDLYISWTGTQFTGVLDMEVTDEWKDRDKVYNYVKEQFDEQFNQTWFPPFGFNNTFALAVRQDFAKEHGLETVSDLRDFAPELVIATDQTYQEREGDGYQDLIEEYDLEFKKAVAMDYGLLYRALGQGDVDVAVAYSTDGRVPAMDLVILKDDHNFFPPYDGALVARNELLEDHPEIRDILEPLWNRFDEASMAALNAQVDVEEKDYADVAHEYLQQEGLID